MKPTMTPCSRCGKPTANISLGDMCGPCLREIEEAALKAYERRFWKPLETPITEWVPIGIGCHMRRQFV